MSLRAVPVLFLIILARYNFHVFRSRNSVFTHSKIVTSRTNLQNQTAEPVNAIRH